MALSGAWDLQARLLGTCSQSSLAQTAGFGFPVAQAGIRASVLQLTTQLAKVMATKQQP